MASIESYVSRFFYVGKRNNVQTRQKNILGKFVSWEVQTLTPSQQLQARKNIGVEAAIKVGNSGFKAKGTHTITFDHPFTSAYIVIPYGTTGAASFAPIITEWNNLASFKVKMPVDGYLFWTAYLINQ